MKKFLVAIILLANPMVYSQWNSDLGEALKISESEDKVVLLYFSVPEACAICEALEKNVFDSAQFKSYANDRLILAKPDFHDSVSFETKTDNLLIVEKYNKDGFFPLVVLLDKNSNVLGKIGIYNNETPEQYIKLLTSLAKR